MTPVWAFWRSQLRGRWRAWLSLALLLGLAGGVALAAAAGARRTGSAYGRFLDATDVSDVTIDMPPNSEGLRNDIEALPQVTRASRSVGLYAAEADGYGKPRLGAGIQVLASIDGRWFQADRMALVHGRFPRLDAPDEAVVNRTYANLRHVQVGDRVRLVLAEAQFLNDRAEPSRTWTRTVTVVGVAVPSHEVVQDDVARTGFVMLSPAGFRRDAASATFLRLGLKLRDGRHDVPAVQAAVQRMIESTSEGGAAFDVTADATDKVERAVRPQVVGLALFAGFAALVALLVVGQGLSRELQVEAADQPTLRALGMRRADLFRAWLGGGVAVAVTGGIVAMATTIALSPLFPIGPVRIAELDRGVRFDPLVVIGGTALLVALVVGRAALASWLLVSGWRLRVRARSAQPSRLSTAAAGAGLPPSMVAGVRLEVDDGRRSSATAWTGLAGSLAALAALVGTLLFGANLERLSTTPRLYGWAWDAALTSSGGYGQVTNTVSVDRLSRDPMVAGVSTAAYEDVTVEGQAAAALGLRTVTGEVGPPLLDGRLPFRGDEVVLGSATMRRAHARVGGTVHVTIGRATAEYTVVGKAVLPALGRVDTRRPALGEGVVLSEDGLRRLSPQALANVALVRFADGVDRDAGLAHLTRTYADDATETIVLPAQRPADLAGNGGIDRTPLVLGLLLSLVAAATLAHLLLTSIRRRRRELAVLKTLGFVRRQVVATVVSQATTLVAVALLVGVPLGVILGRWSWTLFAEQLGVLADPIVPPVLLALAVPLTLLVATVVAAGPAWVAGRTSPATVLRSE